MTALTALQIAAEIAENNAPINEREGNFAQAELEHRTSRECRQAMSALQHYKMASFLFPQPSLTDKARVVGRTGLEAGLGGYGGGALAALLMGIIGKRFPGRISPSAFGGAVGGSAVVGSLMGGRHGYTSARDNVKQRLNPLNRLKKKIGL